MEKITLKTISLKDLWNVFRGCFLFVFIAGIIATTLMYFRAKMNYAPMYSSSGTLYLISNNDGGEQSKNEWTVDYTLANVVVSDTIYVLQSRTVLNEVGNQLGIKNGYGALRSSISINHPKDTRVLEITATASSPELAKKIVDTLSVVGPVEANNVLRYDRIQIYEEGTINTWPINQVSIMHYLHFGVLAGVAVYVVFLCMFLFDNYLHTDEDIERILGISIIGDIPDADANKKNGKYRYKKSSGKSYYARSSGAYTNNNGKKE